MLCVPPRYRVPWAMPQCKSCRAHIEWIRTPAGKNIPIDPARIVIIDDLGQSVAGHISHFATCPDAAKHRKPKPYAGKPGKNGGLPPA